MKRIRVFISSVQSEFIKEREMLYDYLNSDALLGKFFEPFLFEKLSANGNSSTSVYLYEVEHSDIYIGIFGRAFLLQKENLIIQLSIIKGY